MNLKIFTYHDPVPELLEDDLRFLSRNTYQVMSADELYESASRGEEKTAVGLTFDDCRESLRRDVFPLLKKYNCKAIAFLVPAFADSANYCSWDEIIEMKESGLVDFQNHSLEHTLVFRSGKVIDYQRPDKAGLPTYREWPAEWGRPILEYAWKGSVETEFKIDEMLAEQCVRRVAESGGKDFFKKRNWRKELDAICAVAGQKAIQELPKKEDRESFIRDSIRKSQQIIKERLGTEPRFFAPPAHLYDGLVVKVLKEEGFKGLFNGSETSKKDGDNFVYFGRLRSGAPRRLDGLGKESLLKRLYRRIKYEYFT